MTPGPQTARPHRARWPGAATASGTPVLGRGQDTAARIGADEFALLIEEADGDVAVERYAQKIVEAFAEPFVLTSGPVVATASVGVATTEDSTDAGDLVRHADLALYAAKAAGKRQWRRYQPVLSAVIARRRELKAAIEDAVNGFRLHAGLPAHRGARDRRDRGLRGAGAVAAPALGDDQPRPVHLPGRGDRLHRATRFLGAPAGSERPGRLAAPRTRPCCAVRQRERVRPAVPRTRLRRGGTQGAIRVGPGAVPAATGTHRERPAGPGRPDPRRADRAEATGRAARDRRLRHRVLVPELPARTAGGRAEDRQVVHRWHRVLPEGGWRSSRSSCGWPRRSGSR